MSWNLFHFLDLRNSSSPCSSRGLTVDGEGNVQADLFDSVETHFGENNPDNPESVNSDENDNSMSEDQTHKKKTQHTDPDWLKTLKDNFSEEVIDLCSVATRQAVRENKKIQVWIVFGFLYLMVI